MVIFGYYSNYFECIHVLYVQVCEYAYIYILLLVFLLNDSRISRLNIPCFKKNDIHRNVLQLQVMQSRKLSQSRSISRQISFVIDEKSNTYSRKLIESMSDYSIIDGYKVEDGGEFNDDIFESEVKFDKTHAFKVGIIFMLIINMTLLVVALVYLLFKGAGNSVWFLILSMIGVPFVCGFIAIQMFDYIINRSTNVFGCCCFGNSESVDEDDLA